jgi:hypothetical protein
MRKEVRTLLGPNAPRDFRFYEARQSSSQQNGVRLWLLPGKTLTCLIRVPNLAFSCTPTSLAHKQGLFLEVYTIDPSTRRPKAFTVFGMAPDSAAAAVLKAGDQKRLLPVRDNLYYAEADGPLQLIRLMHK